MVHSIIFFWSAKMELITNNIRCELRTHGWFSIENLGAIKCKPYSLLHVSIKFE